MDARGESEKKSELWEHGGVAFAAEQESRRGLFANNNILWEFSRHDAMLRAGFVCRKKRRGCSLTQSAAALFAFA